MNITELWIAHSQCRFPSHFGGKEINGVCMTSVDTYISGCVSTYVKNGSQALDMERFQILKRSQKQLEQALFSIEGDAYDYFSRLHEMCSLIIKNAKIT